MVSRAATSDRKGVSRLLSIGRLSLTGALSMTVIFFACWVGAIAGLPATHMFIGLFTELEYSSFTALLVGSAWALVAGGFIGAIIAGIYNLVSFMEPSR